METTSQKGKGNFFNEIILVSTHLLTGGGFFNSGKAKKPPLPVVDTLPENHRRNVICFTCFLFIFFLLPVYDFAVVEFGSNMDILNCYNARTFQIRIIMINV